MRYAGMGFELAAAVVGMAAAGYWADHHFGTYPRWVMTGAILGIVGGFYNFIREALELIKATTPRKQERKPKHDDDAGQSE